MSKISESDYQHHMAAVLDEGFTLDPPGYERLSQWTRVLMQCVSAKAGFERLQHLDVRLGDLAEVLEDQAFFVAGIVAYGRCYGQAGPGVPTLDPKQVYKGSAEGLAVHTRLIALRNTVAAHTDRSDLVRLTLAVREEADRIVVRHLSTSALPVDEVPGFLDAVEHTAHFASVALNKHLDHLGSKLGKRIDLD